MKINIYDMNLEILKKASNTLYKQVVNDEPLFKIQIDQDTENESFKFVADGKSVNIHSVYDTEFEMSKMFSHLDGDEKTVIVFGLGDGYVLNYIRDNLKNIDKVLVIEPSLQWLRNFLGRKKIAEHVRGVSVSFLVNINAQTLGYEIGKYISDGNAKVVYHPAYRIIFEQYYITLLEAIRNNILVRSSNYSFARHALDVVSLNFIHNMKYGYFDSRFVENIFRGKPLVVVAAGPSLNKNMHLLNEIKNKAVIVAVGSAIKILDSNGIRPHFRMAFDPFIEELKVTKDLNDELVPLIFSHTLFFEVIARYKGPTIGVDIVSDNGKRYLNDKNGNEKEYIQTGSSIAISAVDMGVKYGSSKIVLIGFDASFAPDKLYADGVGGYREEEIEKKLTRLNIMEEKDIYGNVVYTTKGFYMNKIGMEVVTKANKDVHFINATEGGLNVEGMINKTLADTMNDDFIKEFDIDSELELIKNDTQQDEFQKNIIEALHEMLNEISEIERINNKRIKEVKKLKGYHDERKKVNQIKRELESFKYYKDQLMEISFYKFYMDKNLRQKLDAIIDVTRYHGYDDYERNGKKIERYLKTSSEVLTYCNFMKSVIKSEIRGTLYKELYENMERTLIELNMEK